MGCFDLWRLFTSVLARGGSLIVTERKQWAQVGRQFDPPPQMSDLSHKVKTIFQNKLSDLEHAYVARAVDLTGLLEEGTPAPDDIRCLLLPPRSSPVRESITPEGTAAAPGKAKRARKRHEYAGEEPSETAPSLPAMSGGPTPILPVSLGISNATQLSMQLIPAAIYQIFMYEHTSSDAPWFAEGEDKEGAQPSWHPPC